MKITHALLGEHAVFSALFAHLDAEIPQADCAGRVRALGAMLQSALASHAQLENQLLFSAFEGVMDTQMGPVAVMRMEHDQIEGGLQALTDLDKVEIAQRTLLQVIVTARAHFAKEEQILFPMAGQMLGDEALEALGERWAAARGVIETDVPACG